MLGLIIFFVNLVILLLRFVEQCQTMAQDHALCLGTDLLVIQTNISIIAHKVHHSFAIGLVAYSAHIAPTFT